MRTRRTNAGENKRKTHHNRILALPVVACLFLVMLVPESGSMGAFQEVVLMLGADFLVPYAKVQNVYYLYDVNNDGKIDAQDVQILKQAQSASDYHLKTGQENVYVRGA